MSLARALPPITDGIGPIDHSALRALDLQGLFLRGNLSPLDPAHIACWFEGYGRSAVVEHQASRALGDRWITHTAGMGHWCSGGREAAFCSSYEVARAAAEAWVRDGGDNRAAAARIALRAVDEVMA